MGNEMGGKKQGKRRRVEEQGQGVGQEEDKKSREH